MFSTRRAVVQGGIASLLLPQAAFAATAKRLSSFEEWRLDFETRVPAHMAAARRQVDRSIHGYQGLGWTQEKVYSRKVVGHSGSDFGASNMVALTEDKSQAVAVSMNTDGTKKTSDFRSAVIEDFFVDAALAR